MSRVILPDWPLPEGVIAYCSTRTIGDSKGTYGNCNVGDHVGDDPVVVANNRKRLPHADNIVWLQQVHGNTVIHLNDVSTPKGEPLVADAAISSHPAHFCAVMTADCVPVLLCDKQGRQVAAVHAGWKGLHTNIIRQCIAEFNAPAHELTAWIGPAICQQCYEVDETLAHKFQGVPKAVVSGKRANKFQLDLPQVAQQQLAALGVHSVFNSQLCTYCNPQQFYSHRRATHTGDAPTGRIVSVIGLR